MPERSFGQMGRGSGRVLDEFVTWQSGGTPSKENQRYWAGSIPWITPKDMKWFDLQTTTDHLTPAGVSAGSKVAPESVTYIVVRGMILAHTFPVSQMSTPAAFNQDVKAVEPGPELIPRYLAYWFKAHAHDFLRLVGESTHGTKKLDLPDLRIFPMDPPTLAEQVRIVEILTSLDAQIISTEQIIEKYRLQRVGLVERLIAREPPNAALASALVGTPTNGIYKPAHMIGRGVLLIGQTAINSDRRVIASEARRAIVTSSEARRFGVTSGDILVSRVFATIDGVGQPALVEHLDETAVYESNMMRLRCDAARADPFFVFQSLLTSAARAHVVRRANLSNQASIPQAVLTSFPLWLPRMDQQLRVSQVIRSVEVGIGAEQARLNKLQAVKSGLLADLLAGRVHTHPEAS